MKILFLNDGYFPLGQSSPANIVRQLKKGMEARDHKVHVLTSHRKEENPEIIRKEDVTSLPISYRLSLKQWRCLHSGKASKMIYKEIERINPDAVHAHNIHIYLTYEALSIAKKFTSKVFITMHDVMSFAYWRLNTDQYLNSCGSDVRLSLIDHINKAGLQYNPLRNLRIRHTLRKNTAGIIAVSEALKNALEINGIRPVKAIHNGIDLSEWERNEQKIEEFRSRFSLHGRKVIFFGGRISKDKGSTQLLNALLKVREEIPDVLLLIIADKKRWDGCVRSSGIKDYIAGNICCTGWLDRENIQSAFFASDLVTTPSMCLDSFPQTNLEAMAAGKPVIGTCFGGTPEVVENGVTGHILDPRETEKYAKVFLDLLKNPEIAKKMGIAGRTRVAENFSMEKQVDDYLELY